MGRDLVTCITSGGIGNILFQIANGLAYASRYNKRFFLSQLDYGSIHASVDFYKTNILSRIDVGVIGQDIILDEGIIKYTETNFSYSEIPYIKGNVVFDGYFQSSKYFDDCNEMIKSKFLLSKADKDCCSIHVRRGDYLSLQDKHPVLPIDYYNDAMSIVSSDQYLVFSDDIDWCKGEFVGEQFMFFEGNPYQSLSAMASCKDHIIANSSFSWWGSYLGSDESKRIVAPKSWFGLSYSNNLTKDLYTENMIVL